VVGRGQNSGRQVGVRAASGVSIVKQSFQGF
jgi:hypothetical protein